MDHHERRDKIQLSTIGAKAFRYFKKDRAGVKQNVEDFLDKPLYSKAVELAEELTDRFLNNEIDKVTLVFNEFKSAVQQRVVFKTLLPLDPPEMPEDDKSFVEYSYEPDKATLLDKLVRRYLANQVFMTILESVASEHGARMSAMENATNNASDMIKDLTLVYNKARQSTITRELMEIVGGAEALK